MRKYRKQIQEAKPKAVEKDGPMLAGQLPLAEFMAGVREDIETFAAELGLIFMRCVMAAEIEQKVGPWGEQQIHRHGQQPGYVIFAGRKIRLPRPRLRNRQKEEVPLASYRAFQRDGQLQRAVARQLTRQCSTRDYEGALEDCLKGYGVKRSSVSRHWKAATAQELKKLMERPMPRDLLVLIIDSKFFGGDCVSTALGVDVQGKKHVLGLWHGATENATTVKGLLEDLVARGLDTEQKMLIVIDGAKALRKAVQMVLGDNAIVQRCRIHKQRNVLDQLPEEKRSQTGWRLRTAWAKKDPAEARKELRKIAKALEPSWPNAAASLLEGLEETLTVQKLKLSPHLCRSFSNTNVIEGCFAQVAARARRVKHWDGPNMILRWTAHALLAAEKNFRRVNGCEQLIQLQKLLHEQSSLPMMKAA
jgi:transposase-like protein